MSRVFFTDFKTNSQDNIYSKTKKLFQATEFSGKIRKKDLVAIKTHFGEYGNLAFIPPPVFKILSDVVRGLDAKPFITDSNTLYRGSRSNAVDHLVNAVQNGFLPETAGAPVIIADGLRGKNFETVAVNFKHYKDIKIASAIYDADAVIVVSHVKGHELYGFGGAIKNLSMGCAPPAGKQTIHSDMKPRVKEAICTACGACIRRCPADAIAFNSRKKAEINQEKCISCGECTVICPYDAIPVIWKTDHKPLHERTAEYAAGVVNTKPGKWVYLNFIMNVSPQCDCYFWTDIPIVPNIGILASTDPVAIDRASADLINREKPLPGSKIYEKDAGKDNLLALYDVEWSYLLEYAHTIGLGENAYELVRI